MNLSILRSTPPQENGRKVSLSLKLLFLGVLLFAALLATLLVQFQLSGSDLYGPLLLAAALCILLPLRFTLSNRMDLILSRLAFAAGPLVGYTMVEVLNYNDPWSSFSHLQVVLNLVWYYLAAFVLYLIFGRRKLSAGVALALFFLVGMANRYVIRFRGRTIFPGDLLTLRTAANVAGNYDYRLDILQFICLLGLALFCLLLWKLPRQKQRALPHLWVVLPTAGAAVIYLLLFFHTGFLSWLNIEPSMWTTRGNGFLLNFTVCLRYSTVEKPDGYAPEALAAWAKDTVVQPASEGEQPVNLIVIMNESFSDLSTAFDLETNQDPMPFFHSLTENTIKGTAYASVFGGTTANSEYEFLTGNTTAFLPDGTVPFHMYVTEDSPNLGKQMKSLGYETIFMHPYLSSGWNRTAVYKNFGFDKILFQNDFTDCTYMRDYITDQSDYENLIRLYEAKEQDAPLFVFNVTMQNHSAYNVPWKGLDRSVWLTGEREGQYGTVDQYLSLIRESDKALEYLINYFSQVKEPTMIVLFGDHQPQVSTNFYTDVLGGAFESLEPAAAQRRQEVPFLIWANYDIPEAQGKRLSLNYLSSLVMETAGLPMTGYQQFLSRLQALVPVVNAVGFQDADGTWARKRDELSEAAQSTLAQYEAFQYNMLFDHAEHWPADFFTLP